jgi:hypothetical protein
VFAHELFAGDLISDHDTIFAENLSSIGEISDFDFVETSGETMFIA